MIQEKPNQNHGKGKMNHRAFKLGEELLICTAILGGRGISPLWEIQASAKTDKTTTTVESSSSAAETQQSQTAASSSATTTQSTEESSSATTPSSSATTQATSESSSAPTASSSSSSSSNSNKTNQSNSNGIPTNYVGEQKDFATGGGGSDHSLSPSQAGLASWNSVWSQNYDSDKLSCNTAVTTYDGTVSLTNMAAVLAAANLTVNGQAYTTFVPSPMTVNGQSFAGYLTASDGAYSSDFLIVVKSVSGFSVYNLGSDFYYIKPKNNSGNAGNGNSGSGASSTSSYSQSGNTETGTGSATTSASSSSTVASSSTSSSTSTSSSSSSNSSNSKKSNQSSNTGIPANYTYTGEQKDFATGGGGSDSSLSSNGAGLASWNSTWSQNYDSDKLSCNTAVTTHDGNVTPDNMDAVLKAANLSVNGQAYTKFVSSPMTVNGQSFAGYLTTSDGAYSGDFLIVAKSDGGFSDYNLGANFYYIKPKNLSGSNGNGNNSTTQSSSSSTDASTAPTTSSSTNESAAIAAESTYVAPSEQASQAEVDQVTYAHNSNVDTTDTVVPKADEVTSSQNKSEVKLVDNANVDNTTDAEQTTASGNTAVQTTPSSTEKTQTSTTTSSTTTSAPTSSLVQASLDSIPPVYDGKQTALAFSGGNADPSLSKTQSALSTDSAIDTIPVGDNEELTFNTGIETSDGKVTSDNFVAVLKQANITVNDSVYNQVNIQPIDINGVRYMGYLTTESGQLDSHFMIAVKNIDGFSVSDLGNNFAIIDQEATQRPANDVGMSGQTTSSFNPDDYFAQATQTSSSSTTASDETKSSQKTSTSSTAATSTTNNAVTSTIALEESAENQTSTTNGNTDSTNSANSDTTTGRLPSDAVTNVSDTVANTITNNLSVLTETNAVASSIASSESSSESPAQSSTNSSSESSNASTPASSANSSQTKTSESSTSTALSSTAKSSESSSSSEQNSSTTASTTEKQSSTAASSTTAQSSNAFAASTNQSTSGSSSESTDNNSTSASSSSTSSNSGTSSDSSKSQQVMDDLVSQVSIAIAPSITMIDLPYVNSVATQVVTSLVDSTSSSTSATDLTVTADEAIVDASHQISADTGLGADEAQVVEPAVVEPAVLGSSSETISVPFSTTSTIAGEVSDGTPSDLPSFTDNSTGSSSATTTSASNDSTSGTSQSSSHSSSSTSETSQSSNSTGSASSSSSSTSATQMIKLPSLAQTNVLTLTSLDHTSAASGNSSSSSKTSDTSTSTSSTENSSSSSTANTSTSTTTSQSSTSASTSENNSNSTTANTSTTASTSTAATASTEATTNASSATANTKNNAPQKNAAQFASPLSLNSEMNYSSEIHGITKANQSDVQFIGTYLTPSAVNTNAEYGIEGTPNAVFAGLVQNQKKVLNFEIVKTDSMGHIDATTKVVKLSHKEQSELFKGTGKLSVHWTPEQAVGNDLVTGTLTMSLNGHQVAQQKMTTKANMQFGVTGASVNTTTNAATTATNNSSTKASSASTKATKTTAATKPLKISFTHATMSAKRYIAPVQINYAEDAQGTLIARVSPTIGQVYQTVALNNSTKPKPISIGVPAIPGAAFSQQVTAMRDADEIKDHKVIFNMLYNQINAVSGFGNFCGMYGSPYAGPYNIQF